MGTAADDEEAAVESLARVLWDEDGPHDSWRDDDGPQWEQNTRIDRDRYRRLARVAVEAIGAREAALAAALQALLDWQNGPPLARWEESWNYATKVVSGYT